MGLQAGETRDGMRPPVTIDGVPYTEVRVITIKPPSFAYRTMIERLFPSSVDAGNRSDLSI